MASDNLDLPEMTENQTGKEVTFNDAMSIIDSVLTEVFVADVAAGNKTLTAIEFQQMARVNIVNASVGGRTVTVPPIKRGFIVTAAAANAQNVSVVRGSTSIAVAPGEARWFFTDGTTNGLLSFAVGSVFDAAAFAPGPTIAGALVLRYVCTRPFTLPADLLGSVVDADVEADADYVYTFSINGTPFGTATFVAGEKEASLTTAEVTFAYKDVLKITAEGSVDATLENVSFNLKGTR